MHIAIRRNTDLLRESRSSRYSRCKLLTPDEFSGVVGWREGYSHAWIEADGVIVDITADQFQDISERVIVTTCSPWHGSFTREDNPHEALLGRTRSHEADFHVYDANTASQCEEIYAVIIEQIEGVALLL
jgi:hypothetical protein